MRMTGPHTEEKSNEFGWSRRGLAERWQNKRCLGTIRLRTLDTIIKPGVFDPRRYLKVIRTSI